MDYLQTDVQDDIVEETQLSDTEQKSEFLSVKNSKRQALDSDDIESDDHSVRKKVRNLKYHNVPENVKQKLDIINKIKYNKLSLEQKEERNSKRRERRNNLPETVRKAENAKRNNKNKKLYLSDLNSPKFRKLKKYSALNRQYYLFNGESTYFQRLNIGKRTEKCINCGAMYYRKNPERNSLIKFRVQKFKSCCKDGAIQIPLPKCPELLQKLFERKHPQSEYFLQKILQFNNNLSMAAVGYRKNKAKTPGTHCVELENDFTYALLSEPNYSSPQYNMIWFWDTESEKVENPLLHKLEFQDILRKLGQTLKETNPLCNRFDYIRSNTNRKKDFNIVLDESAFASQNRRASSVVALYGDNDTDNTDRGIVCLPKPNTNTEVSLSDNFPKNFYSYVKQITPKYKHIVGNYKNLYYLENNAICDLLSYPLLFPSGDDGWWDCGVKTNLTKITHHEFYRYMIAHRERTFSPMRFAGKLFAQYLVHSFIKATADRIKYLQFHKNKIRKDTLENVRKYDSQLNAGQIDASTNVGSQSSGFSYTGSPKYLQERYLDVMALVAKYGEFDLKISFICNPDWPEFDDPTYRYNLGDICDVFKIKAAQLICDVEEKQIFGQVLAYVAVVEFPKGGLPQLHLLVTLHDDDKPKTADVVDKMISAELPDVNIEKLLYEKVCQHMLHRKCSEQKTEICKNEWGNCAQGFPRTFSDETVISADQTPIYRRREDFRTGWFYDRGDYNNAWVVPYNWLLLLKYDAHISVELCDQDENVVKCLFDKYQNYRADVDFIFNDDTDEKLLHLNYRCIGAYEAYWRIMEYKTNFLSHSVQRLEIHCPDKQTVYFKEDEHTEAVEKERVTTLMAWFELNKQHFDESGKYLYTEIPEHYIFEKGAWKKRINKSNSIGRMYFPRPGSEEYYLRIMLLNVRGAKCFNDLKTVDQWVCPTFKKAAFTAGYLKDDDEFWQCLGQAINYKPPLPARQIRAVFAYILALGSPKNPKILYDDYAENVRDDFMRIYSEEVSIALAFKDIKRITSNLGFEESDLNSMSQFCQSIDVPIEKEGADDDYLDDLLKNGELMRTQLNGEQEFIENKILKSVFENSDSRLFYIDGPAGSGKTFLFTTIYNILSGKRKKVHCISWSGIAGTLLPKGQTVHSLFKLPVPLTKDSYTSKIIAQSEAAEELRKTDIFIWDEMSMTSKYALKSVDNLLRDITKLNRPFGGKFLITGGDFRQILPIVSNGGEGDVIKETVKKDPKLWSLFENYSLVTNLRIGNCDDDKANQFAKLLLSVGEGQDFDEKLLEHFYVEPEKNLINFVFSDFANIESKAIVTTTNRKSLELNRMVLDSMVGTEYSFVSEDTCESVTGQINRKLEHKFLSNMIDKTPTGYPPYELRLKKGAIVMLLRNLDVSSGLTNGTRLIVKDFGGVEDEQKCQLLICEIASNSQNKGLRVCIPRIVTTNRNESTGLPFYLCRKQFPVRLSFCMTINKSQGQTFDKLGVHLGNGIYSHGQLYVAMSRVSHPDNLKLYSRYETKNVVNREILFDNVNNDKMDE